MERGYSANLDKTSIRRPGCDERQAVGIPPANVADAVTP